MTPRISFQQTFGDTDAPVTIAWEIAYAPTANGIAIVSKEVVGIIVEIGKQGFELPRVHTLHVNGTTEKIVEDAYERAEREFGPLLDMEAVREKCEDDFTGAGHITWNERVA